MKISPISRTLIFISAMLMVVALYVPTWRIILGAPQYPEGLEMKIWLNDISGDVDIINGLNHYIGMKKITVASFPEFAYLSKIVMALIIAGIATALIGKRQVVVAYFGILITTGIAGLVDFYLWAYDYGHNLDPMAPIQIPGFSYQPPLLGYKKLLNFEAISMPDYGGWAFIAAGTLVLFTLVFEYYLRKKPVVRVTSPVALLICLLLMSCATAPQPIKYGKDNCHFCKMTIVDEKFGAEMVTKKGKVFKFDDLVCMFKFYKNEKIDNQTIASEYVVDFFQTKKLILLSEAYFLQSPSIRAPMGSQTAAFEKQEDLHEANKILKGDIIANQDIYEKFN